MTIENPAKKQDDSTSRSAEESEASNSPAGDATTTPTEPIKTVELSVKHRPFRIIHPDDPDLSEERRERIEDLITAIYYERKAEEAERRANMPDPISTRYFVLKLILQEACVALALLAVNALFLMSQLDGMVTTVAVGINIIGVVVGLCLYKLWRITYFVCNEEETGISRVQWLFFREIRPELITSTLGVTRPHRNGFIGWLKINWWRVYLDTAAQGESANILTVRFLPYGDKIVEAIKKFQPSQR